LARTNAGKTKWSRGADRCQPADFVTFFVAAPYTDADIIRAAAERRHLRVVEPLPETLSQSTHDARGRTIAKSAAAVFCEITANHENLFWTVEDGALRFEIRDPHAELTTSLSEREQLIWEVIQRGLTGARYLRELHNAGLRPRTKWVKDGCPGTYAGIATESDRKWIQYAQDEKSKIRRKAEAAVKRH
jgi:hypothetical protein